MSQYITKDNTDRIKRAAEGHVLEVIRDFQDMEEQKGTITGVNARYVVRIRSITILRKNYMGASINVMSAAMTPSPT